MRLHTHLAETDDENSFFNLDDARFSGAHDPLAALVLCGAHKADAVLIAGHWRVQNGAITNLDLPKLIAEHSAAALSLVRA